MTFQRTEICQVEGDAVCEINPHLTFFLLQWVTLSYTIHLKGVLQLFLSAAIT